MMMTRWIHLTRLRLAGALLAAIGLAALLIYRSGILPESVRNRGGAASASSGPGSAGALDRDAHIARARELLGGGDHRGAMAALDRALEHAPGDAEALALQVRALRAQRLYTAARIAARQILDSFPESPLAHILLGSIAMQQGDVSTAREDLERAVSLDTSSALPVAQLAALDLMEARLADARRRAMQALSLDPGNTTGLQVLTRASRSVEELVSIYRRLVEAVPGDINARSWLDLLERARRQKVTQVDVVLAPSRAVTVACEAAPDGRFFLRASLGAMKGLRFLVDTGGSGLVLSERLARRMGMPLREGLESAGIGGVTRHSHPILVERMDLGGLVVRSLTATASILPDEIDGVFNPLVLAPPGSHLTIELRASRRSLIVRPRVGASAGDSDGEPGRWVTVPFLADGRHIIFGLVLGGRPAMALLDTGSATDILDRATLERFPAARILPGRPDAALVGFGGTLDGAERIDEAAIRIAGVDRVSRAPFVLDLNDEAFRFQVDLDAIIGIRPLSAFDIRIDPTRGRLSFRPAS